MTEASSRLLLKGGNGFLFSNAHGGITNPGEGQGLYWEDTRHLSQYALSPRSHRFTLVDSQTPEPFHARFEFTMRRPLESPLRVIRDRVLAPHLLETLLVQNPDAVQSSLVLRLAFRADFADVFEVRGMVPPRRRAPHAELSGRSVLFSLTGADGILRWTRLTFDPLPNRLNRRRVVWDLYLPPQSETVLTARVESGTGPPPSEEGIGSFGSVVKEVRMRRRERLQAWGRVGGEGPLTGWTRQATEDLLTLLIQVDGFDVPAAGLPWYATLFGRDSLIVGLQTVHLNPRLSMDVLQELGNRMGVRSDPFRAEERGKVLHELNRGELASAGLTPYGPYYGTVDATALFLCLLHEVYRWTGDLVFCAAMYPYAREAADHVIEQLHSPLAFLNYQGGDPPALRHQGWKDGEVGILQPSGRQPRPPIAPCEAQGYAFWGLSGLAEVATALGEDGEGEAWMAEAEALKERFHIAFWLAGEGTYAIALDGSGERIPLVASNPGHLLMCGILTQAQADRVADRLFADDMYSGWGIRTLSDQAPYYDPSSYHHGSVWPHDNSLIAFGLARTGHRVKAARLFQGLAAAAERFEYRLPELFGGTARSRGEGPQRIQQACDLQAWAAGAPSLLLRTLLGMEPDAASGVLRLDPHLSPDAGPLEVSNVRVGPSTVALRAEGLGPTTRVEVLSQEGPPLRIEGSDRGKE
ncbi:MAG: glycogen debranching N-terminal domain-containing protein [Thermoplasmata archaeon]